VLPSQVLEGSEQNRGGAIAAENSNKPHIVIDVQTTIALVHHYSRTQQHIALHHGRHIP
jgi:hypothetical protein